MIKKCLFPVAGYGTRFLPATKAMPKEMLPILDKPLVQYGVEEALAAGLDEIGFVTGRGKRAIEDHFDTSFELEHQIANTAKDKLLDDTRKLISSCVFSYVRQVEMLGLGHAVLRGRALIGDEPFGLVLADDLCFGNRDGVLSQLVKIFKEHRCSVVAIEEVDWAETQNYGVISGEEIEEGVFLVSDMVEKPEKNPPSNLAIIGRYILTPDIFAILERTNPGAKGELQVTDALRTQCREGKVIAYKFKGRRFDCGSVTGVVDATNYCFEKRYGS